MSGHHQQPNSRHVRDGTDRTDRVHLGPRAGVTTRARKVGQVAALVSGAEEASGPAPHRKCCLWSCIGRRNFMTTGRRCHAPGLSEIEDSPHPFPALLGTCKSKTEVTEGADRCGWRSLVSTHASVPGCSGATARRIQRGPAHAPAFLTPQGNGLEPSVQELFLCVRQDSEGVGGYAGDLLGLLDFLGGSAGSSV